MPAEEEVFVTPMKALEMVLNAKEGDDTDHNYGRVDGPEEKSGTDS